MTKPRFRWYKVPAGEFRTGRQVHSCDAFNITFTPVTLRQFRMFLNDTDYQPILDRRKKEAGYFLDHFMMNFGSDPSQALYGITHDDAVAFCRWAEVRLPTQLELGRFFRHAVEIQKTFVYAGASWSSDSDGKDKFITRNGPYVATDLRKSEQSFRESRHRRSCELDECLRVVRFGDSECR